MDKVVEGPKPREPSGKRSRPCRGAEVQEIPQVLRLGAGSFLQAHRTAGERRACSHIPFYACSGHAFSSGELLRDTEQESKCRAHRSHRCAEAPSNLGTEQSSSMTGNSVVNKLGMPLLR